MADSAISITAGSGTSVDTRTEATNGNHRQVVVIGDPSTNAGIAAVDATKGLAVDLTNTGANATAIKVDGSAVTQPVSAASLPLPTGAATAAKQPALGTAGSASSDVITIQGIASMTAVKVDGSAVTQPVSGTVTANAGTNLNTSALALESGGNLATVAGAVRAEDAASSDGHTGIGALAVRKATPANTSGADGDYEFLQMSVGRLWTSATIDAALPAGTNAIGKLAANSGVDIGDVDILSIAAGDNNIGNVDIVTVPADPFGANADAAATAGSTGSMQAKFRLMTSQLDSIKTAVETIDNIVSGSTAVIVGSVAHDGSDSGNPVKVGAKAETAMSGITLVADGDRTDLYAAEDGVQYVRDLPANPADYIDATPVTITSSTSDTSVVSAGGSNVRVYITDAIIYNKSATSTRVSLKDGSGGTVKAILPAPTLGGVAHTFKTPLRGTANTAWYAACADSVDSVYVTLCGYKSKV